MSRLRPRLAIPLLFALLGCESPTGPDGPTLEFARGIVFGLPTLPITIEPEPGGLVVRGIVETPTAGYTLFGSFRIPEAGRLRVDVDIWETMPGFYGKTQNAYRARLRNLPPGDYDVSVVHTNHALPQAESQIMLRQKVAVSGQP